MAKQRRCEGCGELWDDDKLETCQYTGDILCPACIEENEEEFSEDDDDD